MSEKFTLNWQKSCIFESNTVRDALSAISACGAMMACIVDSGGKLIGIATDSDLRRALLSGGELTHPISNWMNTNPVVALTSNSQADLKQIIESFGIREVPIVDHEGRLQDIYALGIHEKKISSPVSSENELDTSLVASPCAMLILAGGLGTRLRPVVSDRPKPLAIVGQKPVLETVILRAATQGIKKFFISVNYMAEHIEKHLQSEAYADLDITVIRESKRMGTAGSISLIPKKIEAPLIVANSDILTTASMAKMLRQHETQKAFITCAVRDYTYTIPFGVCEVRDLKILKITEKPKASTLVNAGLYVLSPEAIARVPKDKFYDMPELLASGIQSRELISPFYLHEYWIDIGKPEDFARANDEFHLHF